MVCHQNRILLFSFHIKLFYEAPGDCLLPSLGYSFLFLQKRGMGGNNTARDTTVTMPVDTVTKPDNHLLTRIITVNNVFYAASKDIMFCAAQFNKEGTFIDIETQLPSAVMLSFYSKDSMPIISPKNGTASTNFAFYFSDIYTGDPYDSFPASDTGKYAHWIIDGFNNDEYGFNRLKIYPVKIDSNPVVTLRIPSKQEKDGFIISDTFFRRVTSFRQYGIWTKKVD